MRATIISMVMRLPGSLPGMSVASGLRSARERGAVKPGSGPGLCQVRAVRSLLTLPSAPLGILDSRHETPLQSSACVARVRASRRGSMDSDIMVISRSGTRFARAWPRHPDRGAVMRLIRSRASD